MHQPGQAETLWGQVGRLAGVPAPDPDPPASHADDLGVVVYSSIWPLTLALGVTVALTGLVVGFWLLILGIGLAGMGALGWQLAANREQRYGRLARDRRTDDWNPRPTRPDGAHADPTPRGTP
jgi:hypothetical protein